MSTSGQGLVNAVLYVALVAVAGALARRLVGVGFRPRVLPAAVALWLVVAVPSLLQFVVPGLLDAGRRDPELIGRGQWWRVLTSAVVQDGGLAGTAFNLVLLAVVATLAAPVWGAARMWVAVVAVQLLFELWTTFVFPSMGAGNSGLTFGLAASLAGAALVRTGARAAPGRRAFMALAGAVVVIGVALVALLDAHGVAVLAGVVVGGAIALVWPVSRVEGGAPAASTG